MKSTTKRINILLLSFITMLALGLIAARLYLPFWVKDYVLKEMNSIKGYSGSLKDIGIHLWRGAYSIHGLNIRKTDSGIPVPFVSMKTMDISVEWKALFHGSIVAEIVAEKPVLNFAVNPNDTVMQTGRGVNWAEKVKNLAPIDINLVTIHNGKIAYRNFATTPQVNLDIHNIEGEVSDLRNVEEKNDPLPSTIRFKGTSIGKGKLDVKGNINILRPVPDMNLELSLEDVDLPSLNNYFKAFAFIDVERGDFDLYSELAIKDGNVTGYVKPIAQRISIVDLRKDAPNPIKLVWETLAAFVVEVFTNHAKDQFATKVPLQGNLKNIKTGTWEAVVGIVRNAFIEAVTRGTEGELKIKLEGKED